jgi:hypothetical protein
LLTSHVFHRQDSTFQLTPIGHVLGLGGLFHRAELDKGVVALHVNANELPIRLEQHLEIFSFGRLFVKVHHKQSLGRLNVPAAVFLLAFDSSVTSSEFGTKSRRDILHFPVDLRSSIRSDMIEESVEVEAKEEGDGQKTLCALRVEKALVGDAKTKGALIYW